MDNEFIELHNLVNEAVIKASERKLKESILLCSALPFEKLEKGKRDYRNFIKNK